MKSIKPIKNSKFHFFKRFYFDTESLKNVKGNIEYHELYNFDIFDFDNKIHYYGNSKKEFDSIVYSLIKKYNRITLIAHNIKYDLANLNFHNEFFIDHEYLGLKLDKLFLDKVTFVKFISKSKNMKYIIQFFDSFNYFHFSEKNMAKSLGMEKTLTSEEYQITGNEWNNMLKEKGKEMVQMDTEILARYMENFLEKENIVHGLTIAQCSFNTYRKFYQKFPIYIDDDVLEDIKNYHVYRGARVESYVLNIDNFIPVYYYDINSLYPYVMASYPLSVKKIKKFYEDELNLEFVKRFYDYENYNFLINIKYEYYGNNKPLRIPFLDYNENGILTQRYQGNIWVSDKELMEAVNDYPFIKIKFIKGYMFKNEDLFSEFVQDFYSLKKNSKGSDRDIWKIILNSLYGKFGQKYQNMELISFNELKDNDYSFYLKVLYFKGLKKQKFIFNDKTISIYDDFITISEKDSSYKYNPLVASEISMYGRIYNYQLQKQIGFENVLYTDTDSFFSINEINNESLINNNLGKLKLEKKGLAKIYGKKRYIFLDLNGKSEYTFSGVRKNAVINEYQNGTFEILQKQFSSYRESGLSKNFIKEIKKELSLNLNVLDYRKEFIYINDIPYPVMRGYPL